MTTFYWILIITLVVAFMFNKLAARKRSDQDSGAFWSQILMRYCWLMGILLLLSTMLSIATQPTFNLTQGSLLKWIAEWWQSGYHLYADLSGGFWNYLGLYWLMLGLPIVFWVGLMCIGENEKQTSDTVPDWLAGTVSIDKKPNSRYWVLFFTLPLLFPLIYGYPLLGGGSGAYPGALWATLLCVIVSLLAVALSHPKSQSSESPQPTQQPRPELQDWPTVMKQAGIQFKSINLPDWDKQLSTPKELKTSFEHTLLSRLQTLAGSNVSPQFAEALAALFSLSNEEQGVNHAFSSAANRQHLIYAPDHCGQIETIAIAMEMMSQRFSAITLLITPNDSPQLIEYLEHLADPLHERDIVATDIALSQQNKDIKIIVTNAATLSEKHLPEFGQDHSIINRLGLVVWWDIHQYSGVLAANMWAISRRLHRMLEKFGRPDLRTLVFMRRSQSTDEQNPRFLRRLLPHNFDPAETTTIVTEQRHRITLHLLKSVSSDSASALIPGNSQLQQLPYAVTQASLTAEWPTFLDTGYRVFNEETANYRKSPFKNQSVADYLSTSIETAGVCISSVDSSNVLAVKEIFGQCGRSWEVDSPCHIAVLPIQDPYVSYVFHKTRIDTDAGRRIVSAEAHSSIFRRHMQQALYEFEETRSGLLKSFLDNEEIVKQTLNQIDEDGGLKRQQVRFLDDKNHLVIESRYKSTRPAVTKNQPLSAVGRILIKVVDITSDQLNGCMLVDPQRVTIEAYPHRVFISEGKRYRVRDKGWPSMEKVKEGDCEICCQLESNHRLTWPVRRPYVTIHSELRRPRLNKIGKNNCLNLIALDVIYNEELYGVLESSPNSPNDAKFFQIEPQIDSMKFKTKGLYLGFPEDQVNSAKLLSLAQALRHVIPVHYGVEENALDVVVMHDSSENGLNRTKGFIIVDLYPYGIGLIDAIQDQNDLILNLLEWTKDWLNECECQTDDGCSACLRTAASQATNYFDYNSIKRSNALDILGLIV